MPLQFIRQDITNMDCDAIVNAANSSLLGGGGVDGAIHRKAGPQLLAECRTLNGCAVGQAKLTQGYRLPCKYVIHTVGPIWYGGNSNEPKLLRNCYLNSLKLAVEYNCESVAFPLISSGAYGYPKKEALQVAEKAITDFLSENEILVYLVFFDKASFEIGKDERKQIAEYIDQNYADSHSFFRQHIDVPQKDRRKHRTRYSFSQRSMPAECGSVMSAEPTLSDMLNNLDESFSQMLLRKIDEKGITDAQCYKRANIDRRLFSKIRNNINYKPTKPTALAFAISLELSLDETKDLLEKAGFALSHSSKFDVIVEYFIINRQFDIYKINEVLFDFDQVLLC